MKNKLYILVLGVVAIFLLTPTSSFAYFTTGQDAIKVGTHAALFKIDYAFSTRDDAFYMPIFAKRNLENNAQTSEAGYELLEDSNDRTDVGDMAAIILSDAQIEGQFYKIPPRTKKTFTLYVFANLPDNLNENDYALRVTEMPFYVGDTRAYRKLNPSELQYYTTPEVGLNESD